MPPFLALFQADRWSPAEPLPGALLDAIMARAIRIDARHTFEGCPFLGLSAFGRGDAKLFFGRRKETLEALACLGDQQQTNPDSLHQSGGPAYHRWLQIEGNSGSGKSSLVNAGMLPMIGQGALWARTGFEHWRILGPMMPGKDPLAKLAETIEQGLIEDAARRDSLGRLERLDKDERALAFAIKDFKNKEEQTAFLLILDQFEELFTFADDVSRKKFDALLACALQDPECPLFLISTVRADFLDRFEYLPRLQTLYNSHCKRYFLPIISEHGLREVIEQPARIAGLDVSEVTTAILKDAEGEIGALPLVENALYTLWQQREAEGKSRRLSGERYRRANGIAGMLSTEADGLLERIDRAVPKGKQAALELLLRLTRINDEGRHTRQRITREEAIFIAGNGDDALGEKIVRMLSGERSPDAPSAGHNGALRLITINQEQDQQYVDLIHETLIRARGKDEKSGKRIGYWPTLYDYIENNRDRDIHRQQLKFESERWQQSRGLGRLWNLAYSGYGNYRALRVPAITLEGRFLSWSQRARRGLMLLLAGAAIFVGESVYWTIKHELPLEMMWMRQRYRLGYAPLPELKGISKGEFDMGEQDMAFIKNLENVKKKLFGVPGTPVQITPFHLGVTEVTYEQFDYYVWEQQRTGNLKVKFPNTAPGGRGNRPVVNVNWHEAMAYTTWLGNKLTQTQGTQRSCRLPTEAQWEYAARAKTNTAYPWGDEVRAGSNGKVMANCADCGSQWDKEQSAPARSFLPNGFGLYDMPGNVWEWTCSSWHEPFDGNEQRCTHPEDPEVRVVRGGSWGSFRDNVRSAVRNREFVPINISSNLGFRVLCSSPTE